MNNFYIPSPPASFNISDFLKIVDIKQEEYLAFKNLRIQERYKKVEHPTRDIYNPHPVLRNIQNKIKNGLFLRYGIVWASWLHGSIPKHKVSPKKPLKSRDYITCAAVHCNSKSILKLDIKSFFDHIHCSVVKDVFESAFKFNDPELLDFLTDACTYNNFLVQGAITSSFIANLCLHDLEPKVVKRLKYQNLKYTRYIDDITVSSTIHNYDFSLSLILIKEMIHKKGLILNKNKVEVLLSSSRALIVHGLIVNGNTPQVPKKEIQRIERQLSFLEKIAECEHSRETLSYRKDFNKCSGRIHKLKRTHQIKKHSLLFNRIKKIKPLPGIQDLDYCIESLKKIVVQNKNLKASDFFYKKQVNRLRMRCYFIKDKYPEASKFILSQLNWLNNKESIIKEILKQPQKQQSK